MIKKILRKRNAICPTTGEFLPPPPSHTTMTFFLEIIHHSNCFIVKHSRHRPRQKLYLKILKKNEKKKILFKFCKRAWVLWLWQHPCFQTDPKKWWQQKVGQPIYIIISAPFSLIVFSYQIIVADAADAVSVNFSGRCKFLQI